MGSKREHLGVGFEVWTGQWTWFWCLVNPHLARGAVGAAASEADAIREARTAIEEITRSRKTGTSRVRMICCQLFDSAGAVNSCREAWNGRFDRMAEHLARV